MPPHEYVIHVVSAADRGPRCGAPDPGPIPRGVALSIVPCPRCLDVGPEGLPEEATMAYFLKRIRLALMRKLRDAPAAERERYREQVVALAAAGLADPDSSPALFDEGQVLAALYAIGAAKAGLANLRRMGTAPTWELLNRQLDELAMLTVAVAEGLPGWEH